MRLTDTRFGAMEYDERDSIHLPEGLVGMPTLQRFLIADFAERVPFRWLQSLDDPAVGFLIADPALFAPNFGLALTDQDLRELDVHSPEALTVFVLCTFRGSWEETTGNLMGPVIVQTETRRGRQIIVEDSGFTTHEPLRSLQEAAAPAEGRETVDAERAASAALENIG